jgi:hypothetical protein
MSNHRVLELLVLLEDIVRDMPDKIYFHLIMTQHAKSPIWSPLTILEYPCLDPQ